MATSCSQDVKTAMVSSFGVKLCLARTCPRPKLDMEWDPKAMPKNPYYLPSFDAGARLRQDDWSEEDHPRDEGGRFGSSAGRMANGPLGKPKIDPEKLKERMTANDPAGQEHAWAAYQTQEKELNTHDKEERAHLLAESAKHYENAMLASGGKSVGMARPGRAAEVHKAAAKMFREARDTGGRDKTGDARKQFQEKMSAEAKFHKAEAERTKDL